MLPSPDYRRRVPRYSAAALGLLLLLGAASAAQATAQTAFAGRVVAQSGDAYIAYDAQNIVWEIGNQGVSRQIDYDAGAGIRLVSLKNKLTNREWLVSDSPSAAELRVELNGETITGSAPDFVFLDYSTATQPDGSLELQVRIARESIIARLHYLVFPLTSIFEQWVEIENTSQIQVLTLTSLDVLAFTVRPSNEDLQLYWVQGVNPPVPDPTQPHDDPSLEMRSVAISEGITQALSSAGRSTEDNMSWFALGAPALQEGLFSGIEWTGSWQVSIARSQGATSLRAELSNIGHNLAPGQVFEGRRRFLGFFRGGIDDAAIRSHEFVRKFLLRPRPANFPWTQYNTWFAYYTNLDEQVLKREVDAAAALGLEVFYIDAGWYDGSVKEGDFSWGLGSWREDRQKFPSGLAAFADYVHSKGMKFGLWVEPERVDLRYTGTGQEVSRDWLAPGTAFDAPPPPGIPQSAQVCLGHPEARAWMKAWLTRVVRDYKLDWLKWDNNFWMSCDPVGQPRDGDGDYAHVEGLYEVLDYLRQEFPQLIVENCASGGNRMDYGMVRRTDIAWLSDQTEPSYRVRYHMYGATHPFPQEYLNSWLVESYFEHIGDTQNNPELLRAWVRSRMMGAFGVSTSLLGWSPQIRATVADEIKRYKTYRDILVNGHDYYLLPQTTISEPSLEPPKEPDAAEFYDSGSDRAVVFLFKGTVPLSARKIRLAALNPGTLYDVTAADEAISLRMTGQQLMSQDLQLPYEDTYPSTLLFVTPAK